MSNLNIKLDHEYTKLHGQKTAVLRFVMYTLYLVLTPEAILYDTEYLENGVPKYSKIHNGQIIRLEFMGDKGIPFTSYRRAKRNSFNKYYKHLNQTYNIVVESVRK